MKELKFYLLPLLVLAIASCVRNQSDIHDATLASRQPISKKAQLDTAFRKGSNIKPFLPNKQILSNLLIAGQFWAYIKYHHPAIAVGEYNWDAELFRFLPKVINAHNNAELSKYLEIYFDTMPKVEICDSCKNTSVSSDSLISCHGKIFDTLMLSTSLVNKLKYLLIIPKPSEHYYISFQQDKGNPIFKNENPYPEMAYPDLGYRLLALYRYWAIINYFYPYKDDIGEDWNSVLLKYLPQFLDAHDKESYTTTVLKLITNIHDSHANILGSNKVLNSIRGKYRIPVEAKFRSNNLVISDLPTDTFSIKTKFKIGDIIVSVDGSAVNDLMKRYLSITPGSNLKSQLRDMPVFYLLRTNLPMTKLEVLRNGRKVHVSIQNVEVTYTDRPDSKPKEKSYWLLSKDIGYVFAGRYVNSDLRDLRKLFSQTRGIIIDLRCYPGDYMPFTFGSYLKPVSSPFAKRSTTTLSRPGYFKFSAPVFNGGSFGKLDSAYHGRVVMIVDEMTQSQGEFTAMALQSAKNVKVVGSTTAGADGDVSEFSLPGQLDTRISGIGIYYPDNTKTQRIGIKIDYKLNPSVDAIKKGKDEFLDFAKKIILSPTFQNLFFLQ